MTCPTCNGVRFTLDSFPCVLYHGKMTPVARRCTTCGGRGQIATPLLYQHQMFDGKGRDEETIR